MKCLMPCDSDCAFTRRGVSPPVSSARLRTGAGSRSNAGSPDIIQRHDAAAIDGTTDLPMIGKLFDRRKFAGHFRVT